MAKNSNFYPVILAGGRGTRFWPLSRKKRAKQLLALDGKQTMIQQTVARLLPLAPPKQFWIITNDDLRPAILKQLPKLPKVQVLAEPLGRNTAPAIGLAAFLLLREHPDAVIGMFPSDHVIADEKSYRATIAARSGDRGRGRKYCRARHSAEPGRKPDTDTLRLAAASAATPSACADSRRSPMRRRPPHSWLREIISGTVGCFCGVPARSPMPCANIFQRPLRCWKKLPLLSARRSSPRTFRRLYPKCENISVDYAVLEPRSAKGEQAGNIFCLPADFGWNDLGSWTALHEHHTAKSSPPEGNLINGAGIFVLNAHGNYIHAPGKFVAAMGVSDLVVVETEDALLITTRQHAQDVGKVVKHLDEKKLHKLV